MEDISIRPEYVYLYGIIPSQEIDRKEVPLFNGIDHSERFLIHYKDLTAVVCFVNSTDFSQDRIDLKIKDPQWLEEKAFHHHECTSLLGKDFTILPVSFCTIFQHQDNLKQMLSENYESISLKLSYIHQKQEWNIKIYFNSEKVKSYVSEYNPSVLALQKEIALMPRGKQFIMRKKLNSVIQDEVEKTQNKKISDLAQKLNKFAADYLIRRNWGKEITQRTEDMLLNCDFLVDKYDTENFLTTIREYEQTNSEQGWIIQITGPWPPYHFSKMSKENL